LQIVSVILAIIAILCFLVSSKWTSGNKIYDTVYSEKIPLPEKFRSEPWITNVSNTADADPNANRILDLSPFTFILNNVSKCAARKEDTSNSFEQIYFMILVHSAPGNFQERQAIRATWGSLEEVGGSLIRHMFLLGSSESTQGSLDLLKESVLYGDIVSGNFVDSYKNLTYKHLMGYKWALTYCPKATFILKADDDAFVDVFQLIDFIRRTFGQSPRNTLICNVMPEGTHPMRFPADENISSGNVSKWSVTKEEYFFETYPKYCSGLAYLATPDVLEDFYRISGRVKYLWIDDVFVTGIIRELAKVEPFYLNLRYLYEPQKYRKWLGRDQSDNNTKMRPGRVLFRRNVEIIKTDWEEGHYYYPRHSTPQRRMRLPFTFIHLERGKSIERDMKDLWKRVEES
jgi:hypothetical protein